jgi:phosphoglycolate phosphatase-like HAD superfamily hydrolase
VNASDPLLGVADAIFFDCDGVLLDSVHVKERQFRAMMNARIPRHADAAMDYYWRNGGTSRLAKFHWVWANLVGSPLSVEEIQALGREFQTRVFEGVVTCPMLAGAMEFLQAHAGSIPCFVISGTPDDELKSVIEGRGLSRYFCEVHGSPRTKTEIANDLLQRYRLDPTRVWFVGDATTDLEAARNTGIHFIGIDGPHLTPFATGERLIRDLAELEFAMLSTR